MEKWVKGWKWRIVRMLGDSIVIEAFAFLVRVGRMLALFRIMIDFLPQSMTVDRVMSSRGERTLA